MHSSRLGTSVLLVGSTVLSSGIACGQNYPNKPIRIVTAGVGGGSDFTARLVAQKISAPLGQPVIVDNRSGVVQGEIVSRAPPDGYTLLLAGGTFLIFPLLEKTAYDPVTGFSPITLVVKEVSVIAVHPSIAAKSVKELVALAKARPGELNYASPGTGTTSHLTAELFKAMAGINVVHVAYKGSGPSINALIGGEVQLSFPSAASVAPHVKSNRLRALAVTSAEPSPLAPGLPTVAASGLPGYESVGMTALFAPAKTPAAIIGRLNEELVRFLRTAEAKETFFNNGVEAESSTPEQLAAAMKSDIAKWGKLIREIGLRAN